MIAVTVVTVLTVVAVVAIVTVVTKKRCSTKIVFYQKKIRKLDFFFTNKMSQKKFTKTKTKFHQSTCFTKKLISHKKKIKQEKLSKKNHQKKFKKNIFSPKKLFSQFFVIKCFFLSFLTIWDKGHKPNLGKKKKIKNSNTDKLQQNWDKMLNHEL